MKKRKVLGLCILISAIGVVLLLNSSQSKVFVLAADPGVTCYASDTIPDRETLDNGTCVCDNTTITKQSCIAQEGAVGCVHKKCVSESPIEQ